MKCINCGGALQGTMTFCPYCGVRQDIDLRQVHFRDLGMDDSQDCPSCESKLSVIEFDAGVPVRVERCGACHGMFLKEILAQRAGELSLRRTNLPYKAASGLGLASEVLKRRHEDVNYMQIVFA